MLWGCRGTVLALCVAFVWVPAAHGGVNAGFSAEVGEPRRLENPETGGVISIPVILAGTTELRGAAAQILFEPGAIEFIGFTAGSLLPGAVGHTSRVQREDGLVVIEGSIALQGDAPAQQTTGGQLGTFDFEVLRPVHEWGMHISLIQAEAHASGEGADGDSLRFEPQEQSVHLVRVFPNPIYTAVVERGYLGATVRWNTRLPGLNDVGRVRRKGSTEGHAQFFNALRRYYNDTHFEAVELILARGFDLATTTDADLVDFLRAELGLPPVTGDIEFYLIVTRARELEEIQRTRSHLVEFTDLEPATEYEFELFSISFDERLSQTYHGAFSTRSEPDLRPLYINAFDVQVAQRRVAISFSSNRSVVTAYRLIRLSDGEITVEDTLNREGERRTRFMVRELEADVEYELQVEASLVKAGQLVEAGMPASAAVRRIDRRFRTRGVPRPIRLQGPPFKSVGSDRANIVFEANQPVSATVDYGVVDDGAAAGSLPETLYEWTQESAGTLSHHNLTLSDLDPRTAFRYRITLANADGDTFSTDPRGNFQWSRDLRFRTAADADTLPPAVVRGPVVDIRNVLAVVRFVTDVPTSATVYVGTEGNTYSTENEFEFPDLTPDGERRIANRHSIVVAGLTPGQAYRYRLEVTSTIGKRTILEPQAGTGKPLSVLQPPGGAGSFTTSNDPDTQLPVIVSGPTVTSRTHETAIVEWTTDEPADSEVRFGVSTVDEGTESSASSDVSHKVVLSNLEPGTSYSYLVGSTDAAGNGATFSSPAAFTTEVDKDLVAPRLTVSAAVLYKNDETATVGWSTDEEATGEVYFGTTPDGLESVRSLPTTDRVHEVTLTNLASSTTYYYQVSSSDLSNNGPTRSSVLEFTTDAEADEQPPVISGNDMAVSDSSAIVTWLTDEPADSYVDYGTVEGLLDMTVGSGEDVESHEITLTHLTPGTTYHYTVGSTDRAGNTTVGQAQRLTALTAADATPPAAPAGLAATAGSGQVVLKWSANAEVDLAGYSVHRKPSVADTFSTLVTRLSVPTYTDLGLTDGTTYEYRLAAVDRADNVSAFTGILSVTPSASAAPSAPTSLSYSGDDPLRPSLVFANATPVMAGALLTYTVEVSTSATFGNVTASESGIAEGSGGAGAGQTAWTLTRDLSEGGIYYWRVRAVEGNLVGPFCETQVFAAVAGGSLPGDFNGDSSVDFDDFFAFVDVFGLPATDHPLFDLNGSGGTIDFDDFFAFVDYFGVSGSGKAWARPRQVDENAHAFLEVIGSGWPQDGRIVVRAWSGNLREVKAFGFVLGYDPTAVTFESAAEGAGHVLDGQGGHAPLFAVLYQRPGVVLVGNGLAQGEPVSGNGLLAELTFRSTGTAALNRASFVLREALVTGGSGGTRRVVNLEGAELRPQAYILGANYPNPFNPSTVIDYALPEPTPAILAVYDILGQRVRLLVGADSHPAGFYSVPWDATDQQGRPVANGLYFYRLTTPAFTGAGKMIVLK